MNLRGCISTPGVWHHFSSHLENTPPCPLFPSQERVSFSSLTSQPSSDQFHVGQKHAAFPKLSPLKESSPDSLSGRQLQILFYYFSFRYQLGPLFSTFIGHHSGAQMHRAWNMLVICKASSSLFGNRYEPLLIKT